MTYTTNPHIARVRMQAVHMVRQGSSTRAAARHFGVNQSTIVRWVQKAEEQHIKGNSRLETESSRPHHHPAALDPALVAAIVAERRRTWRALANDLRTYFSDCRHEETPLALHRLEAIRAAGVVTGEGEVHYAWA